jgi:hypothetical protein
LSPDSQFEEAKASKECFEKFKKITKMKSVVRPGEAASTEEYKTPFAELVEEEGHHLQQVFSIAVTGLFWKKVTERTYIVKDDFTFSMP